MKIIHTSDWHIGQNFYGYDRYDEHSKVLDQIIGICRTEKPDALLVSGDIFDVAQPPAQAQRLFAGKMMQLRTAMPGLRIIVTAGNHDSASRIEAVDALWSAVGIDVIGVADVGNHSHNILEIKDKGFIVAVPYINSRFLPDGYFASLLDEVEERNKANLPVVMMAHLAVAGSDATGHSNDGVIIGGVEAVEIEVLGHGYDYLALGHIHKRQHVGSKGFYSGSPMPLSFDENYSHSLQIVELVSHNASATVRTVELEPPVRLLSFPDTPASWNEAFGALKKYDGETAYIRLNVLDDGSTPPDGRVTAATAAEEKGLKFCGINLCSPERSDIAPEELRMGFEAIRRASALDIARRFAGSKGIDFDNELIEMFMEVVANTDETQREL